MQRARIDFVSLLEAVGRNAQASGDTELAGALGACVTRIAAPDSTCPMRWLREVSLAIADAPASPRMSSVEEVHDALFAAFRRTADTAGLRALLECEESMRSDPACPMCQSAEGAAPGV
jgi:hypothetical protein